MGFSPLAQIFSFLNEEHEKLKKLISIKSFGGVYPILTACPY